MEINYYSGYSIRKYPYCQEAVCEFSDNIFSEYELIELSSGTSDFLYFTCFHDVTQDLYPMVYCIVYSIKWVKIFNYLSLFPLKYSYYIGRAARRQSLPWCNKDVFQLILHE